MLIHNNNTETCGPQRPEYFLKIFTAFLSILFIAGCTGGTPPQQHRAPLAAYEINYRAATHTMSIKSVDVTPPSAGQDITGKAGLFQAGNVEFDGLAVTAPVYITNNDTSNWTGVVMQAYSLKSGNASVCDADQGTGWFVENPEYGAWGWIFTSGTAGSAYTIPVGGQSVNKTIGFNATSDFDAWVYVYADVPIITNVIPACSPVGSTITLTGYNFSSSEGNVLFTQTTAIVGSWNDTSVAVTVPTGVTTTGNAVMLETNDGFYSNSISFLPSGLQCGSSWPKFHHDIQSTGLSPIDTSSNTGALKWSYTTGNWVESSPAIGADGTIYVGSEDHNLYALNPNGSLKWTYTTGGAIAESSPAIGADGTIYVASYNWCLYALNPNGSLKWIYPTGPFALIYSPAIGADGTIYFGSYDRHLYALNPNGSLKWTYATGAAIADSSPAIGADGTIYVGSNDRKLYALNPTDGSLKWTYQTGWDVYSSPAIGADGTIYIGSMDNNLYALNPNGSLKWKYPTGGGVDSCPAIGADGTIYVGSDDGNLYAINPNGSLKWTYLTGNWVESSPAIGADGTIYVGSYDHNLYALNPNGSLKWKYPTSNGVYSSPAIGADGTIYVGSDDNNLYAIH